MLLRHLINQLRSDYMPFCDQYATIAKETYLLKGHFKRLLSLDDLVDIRLAKFQSLLDHNYIHHLRSQLNVLPPDDPDKGAWLLRLADVLSRRFWQSNRKDDLEEAIGYYEEALSLLPQTHYHFLEAILGFCSCVYQRFQLLGLFDDLKILLDHLHTEHNLNLESLLTPIKAQLRRPQQLTLKSSDSKSRNQMTMVKGLNSRNLNSETKWAKETKSWKCNFLEFAEDSEPDVRRPKNARTTKDFLGSLDFQVPTRIQNLVQAVDTVTLK